MFKQNEHRKKRLLSDKQYGFNLSRSTADAYSWLSHLVQLFNYFDPIRPFSVMDEKLRMLK